MAQESLIDRIRRYVAAERAGRSTHGTGLTAVDVRGSVEINELYQLEVARQAAASTGPLINVDAIEQEADDLLNS